MSLQIYINIHKYNFWNIIRSHCTYYVSRCSLLLLTEQRGLSGCLSVRRYVRLVSPAETAEPIDINMLFGLRSQMGTGNHVLHG